MCPFLSVMACLFIFFLSNANDTYPNQTQQCAPSDLALAVCLCPIHGKLIFTLYSIYLTGPTLQKISVNFTVR